MPAPLSVAILAAAGLGFALACAGAKPQVAAPTSTAHEGPLAAYAVVALSAEPLAPLYLKAIDPFTGAAVPGREPIELGHDGVEALSPDGSTIALAWAPPNGGGAGPRRFSLLETKRWEQRDTGIDECITRFFWSPDGRRIYAMTGQWFGCGNPPRLITLDAAEGAVISGAKLPFESYPSFLSPDGTTLYLFGHETYDPQVVTEPPPPRLAAIDVQTGETRAEVTLAGVLSGSRLEHDEAGDYYAGYFPGLAMSPDGQRMYVAYPDSDRIAIVDLPAMRLERTMEIEQQQPSLFGRFLSLFASTAEAKGGPTNVASLYTSADGQRFYYSRSFQHPPFDANDNPETTTVGPWILDPDALHITKELAPGAMSFHGGFLSNVSDHYIFALRGLQVVVLDPTDLHEISSGDIGAVSDLIVGPAPPAAR